MSTQPLTPRNTVIVIIGKSLPLIEYGLQAYGIPTDEGNVEPALTVHKITTQAELTALLATVPSPETPLAVSGSCDAKLRANAEHYFGAAVTLASALSMRNNENLVRYRDRYANS